MQTDPALFEPGPWTFFQYVFGFGLRYLVLCGGLFWLLYRRHVLARFKIQEAAPPAAHVRHELLWSVSNTVCTGMFTVLLYWVVSNGHSMMYFDVREYGWGWFVLSIPLGTLGFDAWFYWQHRALHTPWLFRHAHAIHHRMHNPTPFAAFAHHPVETFAEDFYFLVLVMLVPMHPLAFGVMGAHAFILAVLGHSGYEFFPHGFTRRRLLGLHNTSIHHNMHHSHPGGNYSLYFNWWDRIMGTLRSDYSDYFDAVKMRQAAERASATPHAVPTSTPSPLSAHRG